MVEAGNGTNTGLSLQDLNVPRPSKKEACDCVHEKLGESLVKGFLG
jgi:hypothetical protein